MKRGSFIPSMRGGFEGLEGGDEMFEL